MINTEIKATSEKQQREIEAKLTKTGYTKISDCMWSKVYTKGNLQIVIFREW